MRKHKQPEYTMAIAWDQLTVAEREMIMFVFNYFKAANSEGLNMGLLALMPINKVLASLNEFENRLTGRQIRNSVRTVHIRHVLLTAIDAENIYREEVEKFYVKHKRMGSHK